MRTADITLVFQGSFKPYLTRAGDNFIDNIRRSRRVLPGARVILSTWEGTDLPSRIGLDAVVLSPDPGPLAPLKLDDDKPSNINRQLLSTQAGLAAVETPYAVKIRTDCFLEHAGFLDFHAEQLRRDQGRERLLACSFFTLDPAVFERLSYHLSDWFQFGPTSMLREYWSAPQQPDDQARYYEHHPHADDSSFFEKKFRSQYAVEQYLCMRYAQSLGYATPAFLNDTSAPVLSDYYRFLGREVMLLDPWQIGLFFSKYSWAGSSLFQRMNNLMHLDWLLLSDPQLQAADDADSIALRRLIACRARQKRLARLGFDATRPLHDYLFGAHGKGNHMRRALHRVLQFL
jgi:hypothetical protein